MYYVHKLMLGLFMPLIYFSLVSRSYFMPIAYRVGVVILFYFPVLSSLLALSHICIVNCPRLLLLMLLLLLWKFNSSFCCNSWWSMVVCREGSLLRTTIHFAASSFRRGGLLPYLGFLLHFGE